MRKLFAAFLLSVVFVILSTHLVLAASGYGEGDFGSGDFNVGGQPVEITSAPNPPPNNPPDTSCHDAAPVGTPDLFQINTNKNSAVLYFLPPGPPFTGFYIAFSTQKNNWQYGTEYQQGYSNGTFKYTINQLKPNTLYYFRLRANNGCNGGGNWSNTLSAKTTSGNSYKTSYKNVASRLVGPVKTLISKITSKINPINSSKPVKQDQPTPFTPTVVNPPTISTTPKPSPAPAKKFCILWWCF